MHLKTTRALTLVASAALVTVGLAGCGSSGSGGGATSASAAGPDSVAGLKIVMFDDDSVQGTQPTGSDGLGLYKLRKSLCAAGADVVVVAPWTVQSGQGSRITLTGPATVQPFTPPAGYEADCGTAPSAGKVFGVCTAAAPCVPAVDGKPASQSASPADAANIALTSFLKDNIWKEGPDLVVSGVNYGQNDSVTVVSSGTVNAALVGYRAGIPAIAASEELTVGCLDKSDLGSCPSFTAASDFVTKLAGQLRAKSLLKPGLFLNVNYPHLNQGEKAGSAELNVLGKCSALNFGPKPANPPVGAAGGTYTLGAIPACTESVENADTTALKNKHVSIVPLDGDWTAAQPSAGIKDVVTALG